MSSSKYAFRRRFEKHNYSLIGAELSDDDEDDGPVTETMTAAAEAGLDASTLSHMEERDFKHVVKGGVGKVTEYLGIRNHLLSKWHADRTSLLKIDTVLSSLPADQHELCRETHSWLTRHGGINYGSLGGADLEQGDSIAKKRKEEASKAMESAAKEGDKIEEPLIDSSTITDDQIVERTVVFLRGADMNSTTERQIRKALETDLKCDLSDRKLVIRSVVTKFLSNPEVYVDVGKGSGKESDESSRLEAASALAKASLASTKSTKPKPTKPVVVVGAGPAGLAAARSLRQNGFDTIVLEGRSRIGGRVYTASENSKDNPLSVSIDFGASIITGTSGDPKRRTAMPWLGVRGDPSAAVAIGQMKLGTHLLRDSLPLYDGVEGHSIDTEQDKRVEQARDVLMDHARLRVDREGVDAVSNISLEEVITDEMRQRYPEEKEEKKEDDDDDDAEKKTETLSASDRRLLGWHWANLEYGCSAPLGKISMAHWNQDEPYGGFGGAHVMVRGGYGQVTTELSKGLEINLDSAVKSITRDDGDGDEGGVVVETVSGITYDASACICTVPLGCLKNGDVTFIPELSQQKQTSIKNLGYGNLNKVALEFNEYFWDDSVDYFGCAAEENTRGRNFMFWNLTAVTGKPVLVALIAGVEAEKGETESDEALVKAAMKTLRAVASKNSDATDSKWQSTVPDPVASMCTRWGSDVFSRGSYSYVAVGASGDDYDELGRPEGRVLFAGEHTCREHPDTVGGAMLSGWRAARHAMHIMNGDSGDPFDEVFALPTLDDLVAEEEGDESSDDDDGEESSDDEEDDQGKNGKKNKKGKGGRKKKGKYDSDGEDGPEDDDAARERARKRIELEAAERLEQLKREAKEATEGKEEVKKVLRIVGDGFSVGSESEKNQKFDSFCELGGGLETASGRLAFINTALDALPELKRSSWALQRNGLTTLVTWLEQITSKESGAAMAVKAISLLLKCPADLSVIRKSGAAKVMQQRFATHPTPEVRLLARKCAHRWTRQASKAKAQKTSDEDDVARQEKENDDDDNGETLAEKSSSKKNVADVSLPQDLGGVKKPVVATMDEMIASAAGLAEGGAAEEAAKAARDADKALLNATKAAALAAARSAEAAKAADQALREAWSSDSTRKNAFKEKNFADYERHKKRKREHKKKQALKREREDAEEAAGDAMEIGAKTTETLEAASGALNDAMDVDPNDPVAAIKKHVIAYILGHLQKSGTGKRLSKERRTEIAKKASEKVCDNSTSIADAAAEGGDAVTSFLTQQRKAKIKKMVDAYAKQ